MLVDELTSLARKYPMVVVIGDMERPSRSIAKYARKVHYHIGEQLAQGDFTHVLAIGRWAREYLRGAVRAGFPTDRISYYRDVQAAQSDLERLLTPGSIIALKASPYTDLRPLRDKILGE
ncbi:MAG TPA: hypothetical protein VN426_10875 [Syntrophomonadaceae bacterium]|nr:hypothetical protein [Syntrophomonadaceae bacterium]